MGALIAAMVSVQLGAALAKSLFPIVGASGATSLRLVFAALVLMIIWRPWRMRCSFVELRIIVLYGLAMGCMNYFFYRALQLIPLGLAVALEFAGPLAVALFSSRRGIDFLWVALAVLGLLVLLPLGVDSVAMSPTGVGFGVAAGLCWALYIVFGQKAAGACGGQVVALGVFVATVLIAPIGIYQVGARLWSPALWPVALGVALLSSVVPYSLEIFALARLPSRTFGVLMSLEPAMGALVGLAFLGERLSGIQTLAIVGIMLASGGSAYTSRAVLRPLLD